MWYLSIIGAFAVLLSAKIFYTNDFKTKSFLFALVATCLKHSWGVLVSIVLIGFIYRYGWFMTNLFNYSMFRVLGRISFCAYMVHWFIVKIFMAGAHTPLYLSFPFVFGIAFAVLISCNFMGLIMCLFIEIPISTILKLIFQKNAPIAKTDTFQKSVIKTLI